MEDKSFTLNIYSPQRLILSEAVEAITCPGLDGELGVLKNHMPCLIAVRLGVLKLRRGDVWTEYLCSDGFMEVYKNRADLYVEFCRQEADMHAALAALEQTRQQDAASVRQHWKNEIHLARIVADIAKQNREHSN